MEDTGWYIPDYEMADIMNWGKDLGCDFVQKSCKNWIDTRINGGLSPAPWCTNDHEAGCHAEGTDVAFCKLSKYDSPVPEIFQVFTAIDGIEPAELSNIGGNLLTDYCPFFEVDRYYWPNQSTTALLCNNTEIIDDCRKSNCTNGGVCRDVINGYYCNCPAGYAGALCDHVNVECTVNSNCQVNEVCTANRCLCGRDRIRNANDECIGVTDVKEYTIRITVTEVNGVPAVYHRSLMRASGDSFRHGIEYEVRQIIRSNPILHDALVNVVTRSISSGNIVVDLALIFQKSSFHNSSTITMASVVAATAMQDNVLRRSGTAYTVMASATVVQDANECEDGAGNDCSPYAQCMNTVGSYECTCQPGTTDTGPTGVLPGRECTDVNECSTTLDTDCSIDADCVNMVGSYTCRCRDGYGDDSLDANRPGRVCSKQALPAIPSLPGPSALPGLQPGVIISLSVGLGVVLLLAVLLYMIIWKTVERRKRSLPYKILTTLDLRIISLVTTPTLLSRASRQLIAKWVATLILSVISPANIVTLMSPAYIVTMMNPAHTVTMMSPACIVTMMNPAHTVTMMSFAHIVIMMSPAYIVIMMGPVNIVTMMSPAYIVTMTSPAHTVTMMSFAHIVIMMSPAHIVIMISPANIVTMTSPAHTVTMMSHAQIVSMMSPAHFLERCMVT
eukprot:XP_011681403.1 PREDICTED: uncharacterized protein LOC105446365 [Strongylocentrotus purpuratus]